MELVDTSVWARKDHPDIQAWFTDALIRGEMALCDMVALEILSGYGSRDLFPVVHYDQDFDTIAGITGQEVRWLAPRGTL